MTQPSPLQIKVFTLYPDIFPGPLGISVLGKALEKGVWSLDVVNIRDFALDKHKTVDDPVYGGGPGMVARPDVLDRALKKHAIPPPKALIYLSPRGIPLTQEHVKRLAQTSSIGLLCGRFEGVDQRVLDVWNFEEISVGDYVLTGGELPAMVLIDAVVRLLPGSLGDQASLEDESFSQGLLEYPQYTRPSVWEGHRVPAVLLSGNHGQIETWRTEQAKALTRLRRPDLWRAYCAQHENEKGSKE